MKKWWPILTIGLLVLGGCTGTKEAVTVTGQAGNQKTEKTTESSKSTQTGTTSSLKGLLTEGKNQKCSFTFEDNAGLTKGVLYLSGKTFKQEITIKENKDNKEVKTYALSDGKNIYIWSSLMANKGIKMPIDETKNNETAEQNSSEKVDWEKEYNYKCEDWKVEVGTMTLPKEVVFEDFAEQMKQLQQLQKNFGDKIKVPSSEAGGSADTGE